MKPFFKTTVSRKPKIYLLAHHRWNFIFNSSLRDICKDPYLLCLLWLEKGGRGRKQGGCGLDTLSGINANLWTQENHIVFLDFSLLLCNAGGLGYTLFKIVSALKKSVLLNGHVFLWNNFGKKQKKEEEKIFHFTEEWASGSLSDDMTKLAWFFLDTFQVPMG